jgi:hypothetical protein
MKPLKTRMAVEVICNLKGEVLSRKYEEVELDEDTVRAICMLLINQYLDNSKTLDVAVN